jgi:two-component system sensor histidine kinase CpxA
MEKNPKFEIRSSKDLSRNAHDSELDSSQQNSRDSRFSTFKFRTSDFGFFRSLSAKILLWFFANLLLVAIGAYAFIEFEFHLGPESLLGGRAGRRVDALADLVIGEIAAKPPSQWGGVLARAGNLYALKLLIVTPDGRRLAGEEIPLPDQVLGRLYRTRPPPPRGAGPLSPMRPPEDQMAPPPGDDDQRPPTGPPNDRPDYRLPAGPPGDRADPRLPPPGPRDRRMVHTDHPSRYWLLVPLDAPGLQPPSRQAAQLSPLPAPDRADPGAPSPLGPTSFLLHAFPPPPLTLIAVSTSIGLGGLVLDVTPWIAAAAGIVLFSLLFWLPLVRGITRSIREMTGATARVAEGRFDIRVGENRGDELGLLARSINAMSARLAGFVNGQKRFLGDIAHELCSPLARAQVALGILESHVPAGALADLREEVQQMSSLVNELLSFSKASLAAGRIQLQTLPLGEVLARAVERENLSGPAIRCAVAADLLVIAEPDLLCRALSNLLRNAVKYAGDAGPVEAAAERTGDDIILTVSDCGPGVPEEALSRIFDPFYRVDVSRARETGGAGLGLAIVKTCVESCGGHVACRNRDPHGLSVIITLAAG